MPPHKAGKARERVSQIILPHDGIRHDVLSRRLKPWFGQDATISLARSPATGVRAPNFGIATHDNWCIGRSMGDQQCDRVRTTHRNSTMALSATGVIPLVGLGGPSSLHIHHSDCSLDLGYD